MNSGIDNRDEAGELQAVMGAYFDALLHDTAAEPDGPVHLDDATVLEPRCAPAAVETVAPVNVTVPARQESVSDTESAAAALAEYSLIKVGGLTLGVPVAAVLDVVPAPAQWTPAPGARASVLGTCDSDGQAVTVVDTAAVLMPDAARRVATQYRCIMLLHGQRWALACDSAGDLFVPDPDQVHWRGAQGKRPWLAGTVGSPAVALLDITRLIETLERA